MTSGRDDPSNRCRIFGGPRHRCRLAAFTALGICVALFAGSLAAYFAVPVLQDRIRQSRARATIADLKRFAAAFDRYAHDHGDWPATAAPGEIPQGMEQALGGTTWQHPSPIGGGYTWLTESIQRDSRVQAAIAIATVGDERVSDDVRQLEQLKLLAKAGGLDPDRLRAGFRNEPIYVLEY